MMQYRFVKQVDKTKTNIDSWNNIHDCNKNNILDSRKRPIEAIQTPETS